MSPPTLLRLLRLPRLLLLLLLLLPLLLPSKPPAASPLNRTWLRIASYPLAPFSRVSLSLSLSLFLSVDF